MVDVRRVRRLLQRVADDLAFLADRSRLDRSLIVDDMDRLGAVKYAFVTAIEGCLAVAQHLCASEGWGPPASNADALRLLGRHGVIPQDLSVTMARAVGFRNVLVHGYVDVDNGVVADQLGQIEDLRRFVSTISARVDEDRTTDGEG